MINKIFSKRTFNIEPYPTLPQSPDCYCWKGFDWKHSGTIEIYLKDHDNHIRTRPYNHIRSGSISLRSKEKECIIIPKEILITSDNFEFYLKRIYLENRMFYYVVQLEVFSVNQLEYYYEIIGIKYKLVSCSVTQEEEKQNIDHWKNTSEETLF